MLDPDVLSNLQRYLEYVKGEVRLFPALNEESGRWYLPLSHFRFLSVNRRIFLCLITSVTGEWCQVLIHVVDVMDHIDWVNSAVAVYVTEVKRADPAKWIAAIIEAFVNIVHDVHDINRVHRIVAGQITELITTETEISPNDQGVFHFAELGGKARAGVNRSFPRPSRFTGPDVFSKTSLIIWRPLPTGI